MHSAHSVCAKPTKYISPVLSVSQCPMKQQLSAKSRFLSTVSLHYTPGVYAIEVVTLSLKLSILYQQLILRNRLLKALHWEDRTGRRLQLVWLTKRPHKNKKAKRHTFQENTIPWKSEGCKLTCANRTGENYREEMAGEKILWLKYRDGFRSVLGHIQRLKAQ